MTRVSNCTHHLITNYTNIQLGMQTHTLRTFQAWARQRNERSGDLCPVDLFDKSYAPDVTCNCLQRFVLEARREDGTRYPPKNIYSIPCGLLRHSRLVQDDPPNFLDRKDVRFKKTTRYFVICN